MPPDSSDVFLTASDQAYLAMGAKAAGQRWFAFDTAMPAARRGEASRFVMAVWNAPHSPEAPNCNGEPPRIAAPAPVHWYKVPRTRRGVKERNRTSLWNAIGLALRQGLPMHAMLKDHGSHRCALRHVYEIAHVHYPADGEAIWLGLNPVSGVEAVLGTRTATAARFDERAYRQADDAFAELDTEEEDEDDAGARPLDPAERDVQELDRRMPAARHGDNAPQGRDDQVQGASEPPPSPQIQDAVDFDDAPDVRVEVLSLPELFTRHAWPLALDTYQRGFVWGEDKVEQLIADLREYQRSPVPPSPQVKPPYYMGTILVHEHEGRRQRFVVDGQQRLTALSVLHHAITGRLPGNCLFRYSPESAGHIQAAARTCSAAAPADDTPGVLDPGVFDCIRFTVVSVRRLDLAFTFFDTQNNRGVQLHATDLLKAYHLRAIDGSTQVQQSLQSRCASRWEALQRGRQVLSHRQERVQTLFTRLLWRARRWTGSHAWEAGHGALLAEFQGPDWARLAPGQPQRIPLYAARANQRARMLAWEGDGSLRHEEMSDHPIADAADLPFAIRQPIHRGVAFFLYADRYAALLARLTDDAVTDPQIAGFRQVLNSMAARNSLFLQEAFLLASLMYADRFGSERLAEFSLWLEHALGAVRMDKLQVRQETAQKFFREDSRMSLTDLVANAFHPQQAIDHVRTMPDASYREAHVDLAGGGVQATYQRAVLAFFGKSEDQNLGRKRQWIEKRIEAMGNQQQ